MNLRSVMMLPILAAALLSAAGCADLMRPSPQTYERILLPLMTDVEKSEFYKRGSWTERKAYLYDINLIQRFDNARPETRTAILEQRVINGMTQEQVVMSWGQPRERVPVQPSDDPNRARQEGKREVWLYDPVLTPDFMYQYLRRIQFVNGIVLEVWDERKAR